MKSRDLTQGNIYKLILIVAIPSVLSGLLQFSYNIIDMFFLGRYIGSDAIAGVGSATLLIGYFYSIASMVTGGVGIKIAHSVGNNNIEEYKKYFNASILLNLLISAIFFFIFTVFTNHTLSLIAVNTEEVYNYAYKYLKVFGVTLIFMSMNFIFTSVMNSFGRSDTTLKINIVGYTVNIILDYLFIVVLDFGIVGAGLATLIAQVIISILFINNNKDAFKIDVKAKVEKKYIKTIVALGYPYALQRVFFTWIGMVVGTSLLAFGDDVIGAQRLGFQIEAVTLTVTAGFLTATRAFVGQNFGASNYDRIKKVYRVSISYGLIYAMFTSIIFLLYSENIASLFVDNETTVYYTAMYLRFIAVGQSFAVMEMIGNGFYSGLGKPKIPTFISMTITPLRLVFAVVLSPIFGVEVIFLGIALTTIIKGGISFGYYYFRVRKQIGVTIVNKG